MSPPDASPAFTDPADLAGELKRVAETATAWPFEEARKLVERLKTHPKDEVLFETGYGPSGLPHIGTFGEVARTTMVRHAFRILTEDKVKTRLLCFSDDMDGMRKEPPGLPNQAMLQEDLDKPVAVGKPMPEKWLKEHTTMFRADGVDMRDDEEVMRQNLRIHTLRTKCGFKPFDVKED